MKRNRGKINICNFRDAVGRQGNLIGGGDGMPNIGRLIVTNLNTICAARLRNGEVTIAGHRLDCCARFFDPAPAAHPEMNLSIHRRGFGKDCWPINIPISENGVWIARDRK